MAESYGLVWFVKLIQEAGAQQCGVNIVVRFNRIKLGCKFSQIVCQYSVIKQMNF